MEKRVMVTGASGFLGRAIVREFERDGSWTVLALAFTRTGPKLRNVDITDQRAVAQVTEEFKPSVVIHSAAERRPDVVEKQAGATRALNVEATKFVCQEANRVGGSVFYISTDFVFDGKNPPFKETDEPCPLNAYGKSKLEGEKVTLAESKDNAVLRVPILYGRVEHLEESAVSVLFPKVKDASRTWSVSDYERRYPTLVDDIAYVLRQLAERKVQGEDISGVYHWSGDEDMSKYEMAVAMAHAFGLPASHLLPDPRPTPGASRPYNAHLDSGRIEHGLGICQRSKFMDNIKSILEEYE